MLFGCSTTIVCCEKVHGGLLPIFCTPFSNPIDTLIILPHFDLKLSLKSRSFLVFSEEMMDAIQPKLFIVVSKLFSYCRHSLFITRFSAVSIQRGLSSHTARMTKKALKKGTSSHFCRISSQMLTKENLPPPSFYSNGLRQRAIKILH